MRGAAITTTGLQHAALAVAVGISMGLGYSIGTGTGLADGGAVPSPAPPVAGVEPGSAATATASGRLQPPRETAAPAARSSAAPTPARPVVIAFGGDVNGEPPILAQLLGGAAVLDDLADVLRGADIAMVNLETAVGSVGSPADKQFTFQAPRELLAELRAAGVDVVSLANNHALDYGVGSLLETIEAAEDAGLQVVGAGVNARRAYAPALIDVRGARVAVVGLSRVLPDTTWMAGSERPGMASAYDEEAAVDAVRAAARVADRVVVMIHWGHELAPCPVGHQLRLADRLTAAGADVIAGHHPHVLQGIDTVNGAPVAYSLGNLAFPSRHEETRTTGILAVALSDEPPVVTFTPARIDDRGSPRLLWGAAAAAVHERLEVLRPGAGVCPG